MGYGSVAIPSYQNQNKYEWKIRINHVGKKRSVGMSGGIIIGIADASQGSTWSGFHRAGDRYAFETTEKNSSIWSKTKGGLPYGVVAKIGDTITIRVDMKKKTIGFMINNKDYGVAFYNIK